VQISLFGAILTAHRQTGRCAYIGGYLCAYCRAHQALGGSAAPVPAGLTAHFAGQWPWARDHDCDQDGVRRTVPGETGGDPGAVCAHVKCDLPVQAGTGCDGARLAHNPEVAGSNPVPATRQNGPGSIVSGAVFCYL
jgi:hypothetical protein